MIGTSGDLIALRVEVKLDGLTCSTCESVSQNFCNFFLIDCPRNYWISWSDGWILQFSKEIINYFRCARYSYSFVWSECSRCVDVVSWRAVRALSLPLVLSEYKTVISSPLSLGFRIFIMEGLETGYWLTKNVAVRVGVFEPSYRWWRVRCPLCL